MAFIKDLLGVLGDGEALVGLLQLKLLMVHSLLKDVVRFHSEVRVCLFLLG